MTKKEVRFGPAGFGMPALEALPKLKELGLNAAEVEFTYGIRMSIADAKKIGELAKKLDIKLSVHAPYYINLASDDKKKIELSKHRILESCERAHWLGAENVIFHAAYYGKHSKEECYEIVKRAIFEMQQVIKKNKWRVSLAPETTGKSSQFGSIDELLKLAKETGCSFCIDFAHLEAREQKIDLKEIFDKIKKFKHIQSHFSGIEYTAKGERRHIVTPESKLRELLSYIKRYNLSITIINESPFPWEDSIKGLKIWKSL
ncbi:MAG: TIM barrel protein [Candidatus Pacearchaeota archaeon]|nr:TIM barrel protein [Candidatus Pacearchaeota archaeon]